jgi:hypothetical protein
MTTINAGWSGDSGGSSSSSSKAASKKPSKAKPVVKRSLAKALRIVDDILKGKK